MLNSMNTSDTTTYEGPQLAAAQLQGNLIPIMIFCIPFQDKYFIQFAEILIQTAEV